MVGAGRGIGKALEVSMDGCLWPGAVPFLLAVTAFRSCPELAWGPCGAFHQMEVGQGTGWFLKGLGEGGLIVHILLVFMIMLVSPVPWSSLVEDPQHGGLPSHSTLPIKRQIRLFLSPE